jgi:SSS family solute:Na+ symporter
MILSIALSIVILAVAGSFFYGQKTTKAKTVTEWAIGGRRFGSLIYWFLNAGEIYTTFAVLGISGFAWASGAPAFMSLCSVSLSAIVGYWLTPKIWRRA